MIEFLFLCSKITADGDCSHDIIRWLLLGRKAMTNLDSVLNSRHYSADKICIVQAMVFPGVMYSCESWTLRQAEHQRIDAFEWWCWKTPESPLNSKEIKPVNFMAHQPWAFTRRTEAPILRPLYAKSRLTEKDLDVVQDWGLEEKGATEDERVGCRHWLNGYEFEQTPGASDKQGSLVCCSSWDHKDLDMI